MFAVIAKPSKAVSHSFRASLANGFAIPHQKLITFASFKKDGPFNFLMEKGLQSVQCRQVLNPATGKATE